MKLVFILFFIFTTSLSYSCMCSYGGGFIKVSRTSMLSIIGEIVYKHDNIIKVKITNTLRGKKYNDTITIYGDKGGYTCLQSFKYFKINDTYAFALSKKDENYYLSNCGEFKLKIENNLVSGIIDENFMISPNIGSWPKWNGRYMEVSDFIEYFTKQLINEKNTPCRSVTHYVEKPELTEKYNKAYIEFKNGKVFNYFDFSRAVNDNNLPLVKFYIDSADILNNERISKLVLEACGNGFIDIVILFLDNGVDPNQRENENSFYFIDNSVLYPELVKELFKRGAKINQPGYKSATSIMHAIREGCLETIEFLLENGADSVLKSNSGTIINFLNFNRINRNEVRELLKKYQ